MRNVVVHNMRNTFHIKASGGDVGGHQDVDRAVFQRGDGAFPHRLRDVAVDRGRGEPTSTQLLGDLLGGLLGPDEDDHRLEGFDFQNAGQGVHLSVPCDFDVALGDVLGRGGLRLDRHRDGIVQILRGDLSNGRRHRGREQRDLFVFGGVGQDAFNILGEAHLQHLVGLVEHQVVQVREVEGAALEVIDHPARGAHHDLGSAPQSGELHDVGLAAVDRQHVDLGQMRGVAAEGLGHLQCQFPGGRQHQRLGLLAGGVDAGQDRDRKRRGFAGAGLCEPDHVGARHQGRNRRRLDRRRRLVANVDDRLQHSGVNLQFGEGICRFGGNCHRLEV